MNIVELLNKQAQAFKDKPAIIFRDQPISFGQLRDTVLKLAYGLIQQGVKKGDRVGLYLPNWPEYVYSYLAVFCVGATAVPLDFMLTENEIISCLSHAQARFLIAKIKDPASVDVFKKNIPSLSKIIAIQDTIPGCVHFEGIFAQFAADFKPLRVSDEDLSLISYTSGTTGKPKGIMLTYKHLEACHSAMESFVDITNKDVNICVLPFSHIAGLMHIQIALDYANTFILIERFSPIEFLKNVEKHKVTFFFLVPSMYYAISGVKEFEKFDLSSIKWVVVFGAPSTPDLLKRFHQYCPHATFLHGWGLTETCGPIVVTPFGTEKLETVGKPAPYVEVKIVDEYDKEAPKGSIGEILVRSWVVMKGYYKDEEGTRQALAGGWFHTGDLGKFDQDGFLYIVGRKKETIKVAGELVYATEVESALSKHPAVNEVAVIGIPDTLRGEIIKAVISLKPGQAASSDDIRHFSRENLAHFKVPQVVEFRDSLPKTRSGKIDKSQLT